VVFQVVKPGSGSAAAPAGAANAKGASGFDKNANHAHSFPVMIEPDATDELPPCRET